MQRTVKICNMLRTVRFAIYNFSTILIMAGKFQIDFVPTLFTAVMGMVLSCQFVELSYAPTSG